MSSSEYTPPSCLGARTSIVGAGRVGSTLAQRIAERNLADVVLLDVVEGLPQGIALDLMEARGVERHDRQILGTNDYADTAGSDIVVITAGRPRRPGMSREDLVKTNANIVTQATQQAIAHSPNAIIIVVTNPLDVMAYLAWEASDLPSTRVIGMAGVLDSSRFQTFIAMELGISVQDIHTMVLGNHGKLMVPLPRHCTVGGVPITELMDQATIDRLVERTRNGGTEIVDMMNMSAYFAPASSIRLMVESILLDQSRIVSAAAYLQGEYGIKDIFLGVPCRLGCRGLEKVVELDLEEEERQALHSAADTVQRNVTEAKRLLKED
mgnify:CR=1 FL=1